MTPTALSHEDIRTLEATRQKLYQITNSIQVLKNDLLHSNPLPPWATIQSQSRNIGVNLKSVTDEVSKNADFFNRTVVFPSTNYPGRTQENILQQLLRKKLEPQVENWVEEGRKIAETEAVASQTEDEFIKGAMTWFDRRVLVFLEDESEEKYTPEEKERGIENVNTGVKADYEEESDDDEEDDTEMDVTGARRTNLGQVQHKVDQVKSADDKGSSMDDILRFATSGVTTDPLAGNRREGR